METVVLIAVIVLGIGIGMRWIHLLNAQHEARIAAHHFSDPLPRPPGLPNSSGRGAAPPRPTDRSSTPKGTPPT
ncbi:hypothetical protein AMK16_00760 [Streptomyces sp. CB00455]|uniref:hypothetical protein n=1 Tax=Streptomyces sp. CB00455 TaxID=1703927 RepID=UPI00093F418F|nr:hypothetical protein [Streptomyces sp. CB00455]OKK21841.1 hypothetical protein AMK16_00760 [Streptomyces sp. CB00455]